MKLLRTGRVRLNGARARLDARLAEGDRIEVDERAALSPRSAEAPPGDAGRRGPGPAAVRSPVRAADLCRRIVFEDADVLAFDKPSGMVSHSGSGHAAGAVDLLLEHLCVGPGAAFRPALVNRLDRDTSGLLILAKTGLALRRLNAAARRREIEKRYLALVRGMPEPPAGEVRAALRKRLDRDGLERMRVVAEGEGEGALAAVTRYRTLRRAGPGAALVELTPETGRTHQLRAHLAHLGHPIALDRKYGDPAFNADLEERTGLGRLFLHAAGLAFRHPRTAARLALEAPLPPELAQVLARLEGG